ncbi:MAG: hypothetical protein AB7E32_16265, partial [Desulfovibrio sp.]
GVYCFGGNFVVFCTQGGVAMPLPDYHERAERMQRGLARAFSADPTLLNLPGRSLACKVDTLYYLAVQPLFDEALERWAGLMPGSAPDVLVRTGAYITHPPDREHVLTLGVSWGGRTVRVRASFVDADFIDRALRLYAGAARGLDFSDLRVSPEDRERVERFFENKTAPGDLAYA